MTNDELEERISADLYELHSRLNRQEKVKPIGGLLYRNMCEIREGYRTAKRIGISEFVVEVN